MLSHMCIVFFNILKGFVMMCLFHRFVIWALMTLEIQFERHNQSFCLHLRLHWAVCVGAEPVLFNGCKRKDIICGPSLKMNVFTWSVGKCVCSSQKCFCLCRCPPEHPVRRREHSFFCMRIQRLNKPNLLCLLSRVSVTPFTTPSDIFSPANLPSSVFFSPFIQCSCLWHNGRKWNKRSRVRVPGWCGDCNLTSPSLRPEDSCGPHRMMNGRLYMQVEQLSAESSSKCSFTAGKLRWFSLTVCWLVLRPQTYGACSAAFKVGRWQWQIFVASQISPTLPQQFYTHS